MNIKSKLKVAVTGSIGSGKSLFTEFLSGMNFPVISADGISKSILQNDPGVRKEIIKNFGDKSFIGKEPDKKYLAEKVFSNPAKLKIINSILHPKVLKQIDQLSVEYFQDNNIVFVESAIVFEAKLEKHFDMIVLITSDEKTRLERVKKNSSLTKEEFNKRNSNQLKDDIKSKKADFVFKNNTTKNDLKNKASLLASLLKDITGEH